MPESERRADRASLPGKKEQREFNQRNQHVAFIAAGSVSGFRGAHHPAWIAPQKERWQGADDQTIRMNPAVPMLTFLKSLFASMR